MQRSGRFLNTARSAVFGSPLKALDRNQCQPLVGTSPFSGPVLRATDPMIPFTYRCPRTGQQVQGWAADDLTEGETYEPVTCTACGRIHLVNPKSGKVLESAKK